MQEGKRAPPTLERLQQVQELRAQNVDLVHCALTRRSTTRRSNVVKPYGRAGQPKRLKRVPKYRPTRRPHRDKQIEFHYALTVRSDSEVFGGATASPRCTSVIVHV